MKRVAACAVVMFSLAPAANAQTAPDAAAASPAPETKQSAIASLKAQIDELRAQRKKDGANVVVIDAQIAALNARLAKLERYWSSAVNGALGVGTPRTISLSLGIAPSP